MSQSLEPWGQFGFGERTPAIDHAESNTIKVPEPSTHESEVKSSQEEPLVSDPPKWDGTSTPSEPPTDASPPPSMPVVASSSIPVDDEVPLHMGIEGNQEGISYSGYCKKKSTTLVLEENHQNTLKRRRLNRSMVLEDDAPSSPIVVLDTENHPTLVEGSSEAWQESRRSCKARTRGKDPTGSEKILEEPGVTVSHSLQKAIAAVPSKSKIIARKEPDAYLTKRTENVQRQKVLGGSIFYLEIATMNGM
ncbi:hypothetical protein HAX54_048782 [Datura stramonium]|uniref:Uncharacterized protein n=1 Tax=Datura stramonium TaxID=4076 RepID=A0ABS8WM20_DATST|nr:hypothetical protein [Datura stramonium]